MDGIQGIADLLAFGRGTDRLKQIRSREKRMARHKNRWRGSTESILALGTLFTNLGVWLVLLLVIPQVTAGNIKGVMLGTFALMTLASFEAVTAPAPRRADVECLA